MTTAAADTAALPAARRGLRDFSDGLSPMLVKELRQGLKSPVFIWGLIVMQAALAVMAMVAMDEGNSEDVNAAFWWPVAGIVCILLPMRVANALRDEMGGNTMDTLVLTRLSAWRITLGKWVATGALQFLVAITALPYLIMRYFAGGVNMPLEVAWLGIYVLFGLVTTAVMLGLSWFRYFLVRAIIMLAVLSGAVGFCAVTIEEISRTRYELDGIYRDAGWPGMVWMVVLVLWVAFFFLDTGASQIAPISENRSTRRRLVALATFIFAGGATLLMKRHLWGTGLSMMLMAALLIPCIQSLCERPANFAPVLRPFVKRGRMGRLAGRLLYPGWHTGLFFTMLLIAAGAALCIGNYLRAMTHSGYGYRMGLEDDEILIIAASAAGLIGVIIMPLVLWRLLRRSEPCNLWRWLLMLGCAVTFHIVITITAAKTSWSVAMANHLLPSGGMLSPVAAELQAREEWRGKINYYFEGSDAAYELREAREMELLIRHSIVSMSSLALWLGFIIWLALRELRETRRAEDELAAESGAGFPSG